MRRPELSRFTFVLLASFYIIALCNFTFWRKAWEYSDQSIILCTGIALTFFLALNTLIGSFAYRYLIKATAIFLIAVAGTAAYFSDTFGTIIDKDMIENTLSTNMREAGDLVTTGLLLHLFVYVALPILVILWVKIRFDGFKKTYFQNLAFVTGCLILIAALVLPNYASVASLVRNHKDLVESINPTQPINAVIRYAKSDLAGSNLTITEIGKDAELDLLEGGNIRKPKLTVLILGETARAQSFSLNGYERETNPELKKRDVFNFTNVSSCGTSTAVSVPCMFSKFGHEHYSKSKAKHTQNVIDIISKAGVQVAWFDNNSNSKGQADRVPYFPEKLLNKNAFCGNEGCYDQVLLSNMRSYVKTLDATKDTFIVLHQIGSHGPSYFQRTPQKYKKFLPECETAELNKCSREEILNAYDNTIFYTDAVIAEVIDYLKSQSGSFDTALLYVSDHGESTGEKGLYLHGLPYLIAPETQTKVPLILWLSEAIQIQERIDKDCMAKSSALPFSHDNLFHTLLELTEVDTAEYDPKMDILELCNDDHDETNENMASKPN